jgi:hypothetical protein
MSFTPAEPRVGALVLAAFLVVVGTVTGAAGAAADTAAPGTCCWTPKVGVGS